MAKAFEKQTKTIENQGEKQVKAIKGNKKEIANTNAYFYKYEFFTSKKRAYLKIFIVKNSKIEELNKKFNHDHLKFIVQSSGDETNFSNVDNPKVFLNNIRTGKIKLEKAKNLNEDFNELFQKKSWKILIRFIMQETMVFFLDDYSSTILEAKRKKSMEKDLKY